MTPDQAQAALSDMKRRHSSLHDVDAQCCAVMDAALKMIRPCSEHGLLPELDALRNAVVRLHSAAKTKFKQL